MRIISGKYRHRNIIYPDDAAHIRPTKDRIREAIFSSLGDITNTTALDLYAGSGAMGIESISRGSTKVVFVDKSPIAIKTIKSNLSILKVDEEYRILFKDDKSALLELKNSDYKFDLVYLDPPYKEGQYIEIIDLLEQYDLLNENAILVLESNYIINIDSGKYKKFKQYKYGDIYVIILRR